jgi:hypothetical protein
MATPVSIVAGLPGRVRAAFAAVVVGIALTAPVQADPNAAQQAEIDHLLAFVGTSQCAFIRNGTSYPPAEAREHLSGKLKYAKARISTAEEFIRHLATESSMSGEPYRVKCDGKVIPAGVWLADELQRFRKVAAAGAPAKAQ